MADYTNLKNSIRSAIKANGNNEITGNLLQQILIAMVSNLGAAFQFAGVATQSTNPGTPDYNVAYLAGPGTYQNMGGSVVPSGYIGVIAYNGSWSVQLISVGGSSGGSVITFNSLPNGTTQILVDGVPQAVIPSQYTLLKLSAFTTTPSGLADGSFYYNTSDKKIYQKQGLVLSVIPYYDGAIYTYNNALFVWNGTDLVNVGGGGADFLTEPDDLTLQTVGNTKLLKFANRQYNSLTPNGLGFKILRNDSTFAQQVTEENTIFEIRYDFDLTGFVSLPNGSRLLFNGGSLNLNGTKITETKIDALLAGMIPDIANFADYNAEKLVSIVNAGFSVCVNNSFYIGTATTSITHNVEISGSGKLIKTLPQASFDIGSAISIRVSGISLIGNYAWNLSNFGILFDVATENHIYNDIVIFENCYINNVRVYSHVADDVDQVTTKDGVRNFIFRNNIVTNISYMCVRMGSCLCEFVEISGNYITKFKSIAFSFGVSNEYQTLAFPRLKAAFITNNYVDNDGYVVENGDATTYHTPFLVESGTCVFNNNTIRNLLCTAYEISVGVYAAYLSATNVEMRCNYIYNVINLVDSSLNECFKAKSGRGWLKRVIKGNSYIITSDVISTYTPYIKFCNIQSGTCELLEISDNDIDVRDMAFTWGGGSNVIYKNVSICRNNIVCKYYEQSAPEILRLTANPDLNGNIYIGNNRLITINIPTVVYSLIRAASGYKVLFENNEFYGCRPNDTNNTDYQNFDFVSRKNTIVFSSGSATRIYNIKNVDDILNLGGSGAIRFYPKYGSIYRYKYQFVGNLPTIDVYFPGTNTGFYKITIECGIGKSSIYCRANAGDMLLLNDAGGSLSYPVTETETKYIYFTFSENFTFARLSVSPTNFSILNVNVKNYMPVVSVEYYPNVPTSFGNKNVLSGAGVLDGSVEPIMIWKNNRLGYAKNGNMYGANGLLDGALSGATSNRPTLTSTDTGFIFFDTTLGKSIVWNGTAWVNMDGTALA